MTAATKAAVPSLIKRFGSKRDKSTFMLKHFYLEVIKKNRNDE